MQQFNKYFSTIWGFLSPISMAFWLGIKGEFTLERWAEYSIGMLFLYLLYNSRSIRYKGNQTMLIALGCLFLGIASKIMHWPYSIEITVIGILSVIIAYFVFFIRQTKKTFLDILKLSWLLAISVSVIIFLFHLPRVPYLDYIIGSLLIAIYFLVARYEINGKDQSEIEVEIPQLPEDVL